MTCITKETSFVKMRIFSHESYYYHCVDTFDESILVPKDKNVTNPKTLSHYFSTE